jgi:hypothetical protein
MFYIGQEVVCIKSSINTPEVKEGRIFTVLGIWSCCTVNIDIGITKYDGSHCSDCGERILDGKIYKDSSLFAPLISNEELQRLLNEIEEPIVACV